MVTSTGVDLGKSGMKPWSAFFFSWKYQKSSRIHSTICKQIPHINHDLKEKEKRKKKEDRDILVQCVRVLQRGAKHQMLCNTPNSSKLRERGKGAEDERST